MVTWSRCPHNHWGMDSWPVGFWLFSIDPLGQVKSAVVPKDGKYEAWDDDWDIYIRHMGITSAYFSQLLILDN